MTLADEFRTRNFSIYGQWTGVICILLCFAVGIANMINLHIIVVWSAICLASSFVIIFVEIPFLLRICPTSSTFDNFIRRFATNYTRALIYLIMSAIQWSSLATKKATSLLAAAALLLIAAAFYALAGLKKQDFMSSKTLGGQGIAQMIV